ncbi:hypothetical protein [Blastococcus sp. SYSU D01042]
MTFVIALGSAWALLAVPVAVLVGRGIRLADDTAAKPFRTDDVEAFLREQASARS